MNILDVTKVIDQSIISHSQIKALTDDLIITCFRLKPVTASFYFRSSLTSTGSKLAATEITTSLAVKGRNRNHSTSLAISRYRWQCENPISDHDKM